MIEVVVVVLAVALVAAGIALVRVSSERARLAGERDLAQQRLADVERNGAQLKDSFAALANDSLHKNSEQFLRLAEQKLAARESSAVAEMDKRRAAVDQLLQPINQALAKTHEELRKLESERTTAYAGLKAQVVGMQQASEQLRTETARLAQSMSSPNVRGRYGELQLQRVAELAGMRSYCDFATQETQTGADGKLLRPDMLVKLPNERVIAVDAKTNISAYLEAMKAATAELAEPHLQRFAQHVVEQIQALSKKGYWREIASPEFVVMFVPGDQFLDAALSRKPDLIDVAAQANVVIASPSTLIGLLRAIHVGWREKRLSDSAHELFELGKELHGRVATALGFADKLSRSLGGAVEDYNRFVASVESRLMPTLRKFEDAGIQVGKPIDELTPIERAPRTLAAQPPRNAIAESPERT